MRHRLWLVRVAIYFTWMRYKGVRACGYNRRDSIRRTIKPQPVLALVVAEPGSEQLEKFRKEWNEAIGRSED